MITVSADLFFSVRHDEGEKWYGKPIVLPPVCISEKLKEIYRVAHEMSYH